MSKTYSYLALGDSYTIGEGVPIYESFPYQTVQLLRKAGYGLYAAEIVAKTGWTTDELQTGIANSRLLPQYDLVSAHRCEQSIPRPKPARIQRPI